MSAHARFCRDLYLVAARVFCRRTSLSMPLRCLFGTLLLTSTVVQAAPFAYLADRVLNTVDVVDVAGYTTLATAPLGAERAPARQVIANEATGKIFIAERTGILIIDATTNTITGEIPIAVTPPLSTYDNNVGVKALAVAPDGSRVYALSTGKLTVIDPAKKIILATIPVNPSAISLAIDADGETVFIAQTGLLADNVTVSGPAGVTVFDTLILEIDRVIPTPGFLPYALAIHPANERLYLVGSKTGPGVDYSNNRDYLVLDSVTDTLKRFSVAKPADYANVFSFSSLAFNADGSRLYLGTNSLSSGAVPLLEVNASNGVITRVLKLPSSFADQHSTLSLATSFADNKFVLAAFLSEHLHHYPSEPPRRVVFMDGLTGNVLKNMVFTSPSPSTTATITGDFLDRIPAPGPVPTTTTLDSSPKPPLRRHLPVSFYVDVTGDNPTGTILFKFVAQDDRRKLVRRIPMPLSAGKATLTLPACNDPWQDHALRKIVCSAQFSVVALYRGDTAHRASKSAVLEETR
ncbi:YncE family protein [Actimicrobium sp. CCI2.3]|uniref:YncE family protein n=1 Tax=Actimicrobium sp. CCI2.3 TaxID=3048616 RepID=UPI002AB47AAF|nr:YncE family protein [Actimicrobium sp. CCI2.3]MDY7574190.1 YncE family protein [Actimicrobium sp. CCI2.3]MEB0023847.1 YncE family protein [Actimicrobium sp. CCI2.3]